MSSCSNITSKVQPTYMHTKMGTDNTHNGIVVHFHSFPLPILQVTMICFPQYFSSQIYLCCDQADHELLGSRSCKTSLAQRSWSNSTCQAVLDLLGNQVMTSLPRISWPTWKAGHGLLQRWYWPCQEVFEILSKKVLTWKDVLNPLGKQVLNYLPSKSWPVC
jgi:hypothetical protein